jgi:hypothetical protein
LLASHTVEANNTLIVGRVLCDETAGELDASNCPRDRLVILEAA